MPACFRVEGKHVENEAFQKRWRQDNYAISLTQFSSNTDPTEMTDVCCVLNFAGVV